MKSFWLRRERVLMNRVNRLKGWMMLSSALGKKKKNKALSNSPARNGRATTLFPFLIFSLGHASGSTYADSPNMVLSINRVCEVTAKNRLPALLRSDQGSSQCGSAATGDHRRGTLTAYHLRIGKSVLLKPTALQTSGLKIWASSCSLVTRRDQ